MKQAVTFANFDALAAGLAWGLSRIHAIRFYDRKDVDVIDGTCTLVFEITYMNQEGLVAPAELVFYDARQVLVSFLDFTLEIKIHDLKKEEATDNPFNRAHYTFDLLGPGDISLSASSVQLYVTGAFAPEQCRQARAYDAIHR